MTIDSWIALLFLAVMAVLQTGCVDENCAYPPEIASWTEETKEAQREAARRFVARAQEAVAKKQTHLKVEPGHYRFGRQGPQQFILRGVNDLTIDAAGATFWFDGRFRIDSVSLQECRNVSIRGLTVDYDPMCFAQGEIVAIDPKGQSVDIRIDPGFPLPDKSWTENDGSIKAIFYNRERRQIEVRMDWIKSLDPLGERLFRVTFKFGWIFQEAYKADINIGDRLTLPDRSMRHSFNLGGSESITLEDVTIYACPHMALTECGGTGKHVYRRCRVIRRPRTKRLLACNADVFHSTVVANGPTIEDCEFSHSGDDFVNIHGLFSMVYEQRSPKEVVVVSHYTDTSFSVGAALHFYRFDDLKPLGARQVKQMRLLEGKDIFEAAKRMPEEIRQKGAKLRDFHPRNIYAHLVEIDGPVEVTKYDLVGSEDRMGAGAVLRSNYFHDGFTRGILLKCINAVIENNTIERVGQGSICVAAERYWMEGPFSHDILIRSNTIIDNGTMLHSRIRPSKPGAITVISEGGHELCPYIHSQRIRIIGNKIVRPAACGIFVANARDVEIMGNAIEEAFSKQPVDFGLGLKIDDPRYAIYLAAAQEVTIRGNRIVSPARHCIGDVGLGKWVDKVTDR